MKTAISIPDVVFKAADRLAKRRKLSRSQLYTHALQALLQREGEAEVTARLNEVYADDDGRLDAGLRSIPGRVLEREEW